MDTVVDGRTRHQHIIVKDWRVNHFYSVNPICVVVPDTAIIVNDVGRTVPPGHRDNVRVSFIAWDWRTIDQVGAASGRSK